MFNGKPVTEEDKNELEKVLKEFFIRALLKKRADENNDGKKKKIAIKLWLIFFAPTSSRRMRLTGVSFWRNIYVVSNKY